MLISINKLLFAGAGVLVGIFVYNNYQSKDRSCKKSKIKKISTQKKNRLHWGLNHSLIHLHKMRRVIVDMPIKEQAKYADSVLRNNVKNKKWLENQLKDSNPEYNKWNTTSVGNTAYICLYASEKKHRKKAEKLLQGYKKYIHKKFD